MLTHKINHQQHKQKQIEIRKYLLVSERQNEATFSGAPLMKTL